MNKNSTHPTTKDSAMSADFQKLTLLLDPETHTFYLRRDGHMMELDAFMADQSGEVLPAPLSGESGLTFIHEFTSEAELDEWYEDSITGLNQTETFEDETEETETIGYAQTDYVATAHELDEMYRAGVINAQPISGDAPLLQKL